jgi:release factor glutamine methyltransferase
MLPTPDTSHVPYQRVYEPAEDSFLLLDTLASPAEVAFLHARFSSPDRLGTPPPLVLEIGSGSGVVIAFLAAHAHHIFGRPDVLAVAADVNAHACRATAATVARAVLETTTTTTAQETTATDGGPTASSASFFLGAMQADLAGTLRAQSVDFLVCNPPYVPTEALPSWRPQQQQEEEADCHEADSRLLALSYAGGKDGMEMTSRLIAALPDMLSPRGCAYVLLCAQNRPADVKAEAVRLLGEGWRAKTVGSSGKTAGWEQLVIVRIWRDGLR